MEENLQADDGLSLLDVIRVLYNRLKLLVLLVLIGAVAGAAFAVWRTHDVKYYGTTVEFYVNPEKPKETGASSSLTQNAASSQYGVYGAYGRHVMDAIVKLLTSESFAEQLMLEENGLPSLDPVKGYPNIDEAEYNEALTAIETANAAWKAATDLDGEWAQKMNALNQAWKEAGMSGSFSESSYYKLLNSPEGVSQNLADAFEAASAIDKQRDTLIKNAETVQKTTDHEIEDVLRQWRKTDKYKTDLEKFKASIAYSYLGDSENTDDANNLARSFIYVKISVLNDQEFANDLLDRVKTKVPDYVEKNMIVPTDYEGTSCTRITRTDDIQWTNPTYTRNSAIKYALIVAIAVGLIAAVVVIVVDRLDKRLRDYEVLTKRFNVPVLGIIPTIEELGDAETKNKTAEAKK